MKLFVKLMTVSALICSGYGAHAATEGEMLTYCTSVYLIGSMVTLKDNPKISTGYQEAAKVSNDLAVKALGTDEAKSQTGLNMSYFKTRLENKDPTLNATLKSGQESCTKLLKSYYVEAVKPKPAQSKAPDWTPDQGTATRPKPATLAIAAKQLEIARTNYRNNPSNLELKFAAVDALNDYENLTAAAKSKASK